MCPLNMCNPYEVEGCMLACGGTSVLDPACRLITGSAALLVCVAASAVLKLQQEARAGKQYRLQWVADPDSACLQVHSL